MLPARLPLRRAAHAKEGLDRSWQMGGPRLARDDDLIVKERVRSMLLVGEFTEARADPLGRPVRIPHAMAAVAAAAIARLGAEHTRCPTWPQEHPTQFIEDGHVQARHLRGAKDK